MTELVEKLFSLQDPKFREFHRKLIPNVPEETVIGVRTPELRKLASSVEPSFRKNLPHRYYEENQIHAFSLENMRDFDIAIREVESFLPYVDNWATCDQLRPKVFAKYPDKLLPFILCWLASDRPYTVRFGVEMLMCHYLDDRFDPKFPELVAEIRHEDYYVRMMQAWYFATALAEQYDAVIPYITNYRLEPWIHNKTIQKAIESRRILPDQKAYLRNFKV